MLLILLFFMLAIAFSIAAALSSTAIYGAAYLVKAEKNDFLQNFWLVFRGYLVVYVVEICLLILNIRSPVLEGIIVFGALYWVMSSLIKVLIIRRTTDIILFVLISLFLNIILFTLFWLFMK